MPGFVDTEYVSCEEKLRYEALSPGKKMIDVHTVADAVMFLIENPAVSGTLLTVDGGLNIWICYKLEIFEFDIVV